MQWNADKFLSEVDVRMGNGASRACRMLRDKMKARSSTPYPPASSPGESPHRRTGRLIQRMVTRRRGLSAAQTLSTAKYAAYLEHGTSKMLPRPYVRVTLDENHEAITQEFAAGMRGGGE